MIGAATLAALLLASGSERSLYSGSYGEEGHPRLMIATDLQPDQPGFTGYYDDGRCRFAFRGEVSPVPVERLQTYPEGYEAEAWVPDHPERIFPILLYSQVRDGYRQQITVETGERPAACPSRLSLDRFGAISDGLAVRVVKPGPVRMYDVRTRGGRTILVRKHGRPPRPWAGVWVMRTYSSEYRPRGFLRVSWHVSGWPRGAYLRTGALFPLPPISSPWTPSDQ